MSNETWTYKKPRPRRRMGRMIGITTAIAAVVAGATVVVLAVNRSDGNADRSATGGDSSLGVPGSPGGVLPSGSAGPSASASPSASPSPSAASLSKTAAAKGGTGVKLRGVDGGTGYYGKFSPGLPTSASFFPVAVWFESVSDSGDTAKDKAAGLNTYVELTDSSRLDVVKAAGMYAITDQENWSGDALVGHLLSDEADMWGGPGSATWTGKYPGDGTICNPGNASCGYTVQSTLRGKLPADKRMRYANYGKGITFWQSDSQAAKFVNTYQDLLSADNYWFTDNNICTPTEGGSLFGDRTLSSAECHRASNYGKTIDRVRSLVSPKGSKPVWAFVELGHPFTEGDWPSITGAQATAAVWSSLIHGARGIIYFNHSFAGDCQTQHALRDSCYSAIRQSVTAVNARVKALAPVLNAPFADNVVKGSAGVDVSLKWYNGNFYLLAGSNGGTGKQTFKLPCIGKTANATVLDEGRSIPISGGTFSDTFANSNAVHIYRIDGGSSCGAY
ncbi:hypothetical protein [Hamadaea tsunoensis]|uniref:hypothetical protein n=1 Tax=Hamadaea tsunoensis TaxID=53368 RepID=UPI001B7FCCF6|nr:hypothetical protein [Hamadaea tsunoensis]